MSSPPIETLGPDSYDELVSLWKEAGLPFKSAGRDSREAIATQMGLPFCRFFAVRDPRGLLLGAVVANHEGRKGWINRLAVRPSARRSGIAKALVEACEDWLFGQGVPIVAALVEGDNLGSQGLFAACDYERDDTLVYFRKLIRPGV